MGIEIIKPASAGATIGRGVLSSRPGAGNSGDLYYATDLDIWFRDNGSSWDVVGGGIHAQLFNQLNQNGELPANVAFSCVDGSVPTAFDGEVLSGVTIDEVKGAFEFRAGASPSGSQYGYLELASAKSEILIVCGYDIAVSSLGIIGAKSGLWAGSTEKGDGYATYITRTSDGRLFRYISNSGAEIGTQDDRRLPSYSSHVNALRLAANRQDWYECQHGGAYLLDACTDANHSSFQTVYVCHSPSANQTVRFFSPFIVMTN